MEEEARSSGRGAEAPVSQGGGTSDASRDASKGNWDRGHIWAIEEIVGLFPEYEDALVPHADTRRPWFAISWFMVWGLFQAFVVMSILNGTWERPDAFPPGAYESLIYPDMFFVPIYLLAAVGLWARHRIGVVLALVASGGVVYVMIYLQALAGLSGAVNVVADGVFLVCALASIWQVGSRVRLARI